MFEKVILGRFIISIYFVHYIVQFTIFILLSTEDFIRYQETSKPNLFSRYYAVKYGYTHKIDRHNSIFIHLYDIIFFV